MHSGFIKRVATKLANSLLNFSAGMIMAAHPEWSPRAWSNRELRKLGPLFTGSVLNVSAMKDGDKEGGFYKAYFPNAKSYTITNYGQEIGLSGNVDEKQLDISIPYDGSIGMYDVVFAHTVLEHVYPCDISIKNLCSLCKETLIIVSPFLQGMHGKDGFYCDYYRFTPRLFEKKLQEYGFTTIYSNWNDDHPLLNVYIIHIATRFPAKYENLIHQPRKLRMQTDSPGLVYSKMLWPVIGDARPSFARRLGEYIGHAVKER